MAKPTYIELGTREQIPILYENRSVLAIDKPAGWMLVPYSWQRTQRNLQAAVTSAIAQGRFWARSRNLTFLRHIHRLDGDTSGVLLLGKSSGAVRTYGDLFESRQMEKTYLAVVQGRPSETRWLCRLRLAPDPKVVGKVRVDRRGKEAETRFQLLDSRALPGGTVVSLVQAQPITGRTHQIRVHLAAAGCPVLGDPLYSPDTGTRPEETKLGLRAIRLVFTDPFEKRLVDIRAPTDVFLREFGFVGERGA